MLVLAGLLAMQGGAPAATVSYWNFNSEPPDGSASSGTTASAIGFGAASLLGGTTGTFAAGSGSDPSPDNTGWSTAGYPPANAGNKTAGVQFRVSTRGYSNIVITWDQRVSGSASRYARFQYSLDGSEYVDGPVIEMASNNTFYAKSVSLAGVSGASDNPNFGFRVVAEFENSASGSGLNGYVTPLGASYSVAGTVRFDAVRLNGDPLNPDNTPPTIEPIPDLTTLENQPIVDYPIVISDDGTPDGELIVRVTSGNTNVIPSSGLVLAQAGAGRRLTITPRPNVFGDAVITLTASDAESLSAARSFRVTVIPVNVPPAISAIPHQRRVLGGENAPVPFTVSDVETSAEALAVSVVSSNPSLIETTGFSVEGTGGDRLLRLVPVAGQAGTAVITVRVTDAGGRAAQTAFVLSVVPVSTTLWWETFGYADGPLVENAAGLWQTHGGTTGQVQVLEGRVRLSSGQTEDVHVLLPDGVISTGSIYLGFDVRFSALPTGGEYFAHLNHASGFRARIFAGTNGAAPGFFRLSIGNGGSSGLGQSARDLALNTTYDVIVKYDVAGALSSLWIDPVAESDPAAAATDSTTSVSINSVALRNASGIGDLRIGLLRIGRSFADVAGTSAGSGPMLSVVEVGDQLEVSWPATATGYRLQSNPGVRSTDWTDELTTPAAAGGRSVVSLPKTGASRFFRLIR
jgi:hypothetical protein